MRPLDQKRKDHLNNTSIDKRCLYCSLAYMLGKLNKGLYCFYLNCSKLVISNLTIT